MPPYLCSFCDAEFQRSTHLARHRLLHLGERPFECPSCDRTFTRRDTLQRHVAVHGRSRERDGKGASNRRIKHACRKCSHSKQRCDGKKPCTRCIQKNLGCTYPILQSPASPNVQSGLLEPIGDSPDHLQADHLQSAWPRENDDQTGNTVSVSAAPLARSLSIQPEFTTEHRSLDSIPLMTDYPCDMPFSAMPAASQQSTMQAKENNLPHLSASDSDPFDANVQDMAFWDVSQYLDTLYHGPDTDFGFVMPVDNASCPSTEISAPEPELDQSASPPVPTFLDARASPEPLEGQGLRFDDYIRKSFGNRRHLTKRNGTTLGSGSAKDVEKAHIPPIIGDFPASLASADCETMWEPENLGHVGRIPQRVYDEIVARFQKLNVTNDHYIQFAGGKFPSLAACNAFMQLYFEEFHPLFPLLHQPTFDPSSKPVLLVLATISTGIRFSRESAAVECGDIMQEFLRRAFNATIEADYSSTCEPWLAQAGLLNQIGMNFSQDMRLTQSAQSMRSLLSSLCRQVNCFREVGRPADITNRERSAEDAWRAWLRRESVRRLAYTLWLVDSQYLLYYDLPPLIPLSLMRIRLPCTEELWNAPTATMWLQSYNQKETYTPLSIREELNNLYKNSVRQPGLGDFAVLLLVVGVFRSAIDVRRTLQECPFLLPGSLSHESPLSTTTIASAETFPAARNAMQYIQILCPDNEETFRRSSLKSTIVHHHHAIGVLLGIPLGELFCFCGYRVTSTDIAHCEKRLKVWFQQRGEEIRQVALHAGRLFAHIRHSNLHGYYEGRAMLLACQALWIYAATAESTRRSHDENHEGDRSGHTSVLTIRLDQLLTREAEDAWMQNGDRMRPCLAGVGSLSGAAGVSRLIQEGTRVMCSTPTWPLNNALGKCLRIYHQFRAGPSFKESG